MKNIGEIIRKHRKLKNLTQEELGNKLFVSKQAVSKWERGQSCPDILILDELANILGVEIKDFFDQEKPS